MKGKGIERMAKQKTQRVCKACHFKSTERSDFRAPHWGFTGGELLCTTCVEWAKTIQAFFKVKSALKGLVLDAGAGWGEGSRLSNALSTLED